MLKITPKTFMSKLASSIMLVAVSVSSSFASTQNLLDIYQLAKLHDPKYQYAIAKLKDNKEALPQSVANMLFKANASADVQQVKLSSGSIAQGYAQHDYSISIDQPLINFANYSLIKSTSKDVKAAYYDWFSAQQSLILRVASGYFDLLQSYDNLRLMQSQETATLEQLQEINKRFSLGLDTITSVYSAKAQYARIQSNEISAKNDISAKQQKLQEITGVPCDAVAPLIAVLPIHPPVPNSLSTWINAAIHTDPDLRAASYRMSSSQEKINVAYDDYYPTVDAKASYGYANAPINSGNLSGHQTTVMLNLNIPIFNNNGLTSSKTKQAEAQFEEAAATRDENYKSALSNTTQTFNSVLTDISKLSADQQTIAADRLSIQGLRAAYKVGTGTLLNIFQAQDSLSQDQKNYASDEYHYLNDQLQLKALAGQLTMRDLVETNDLLISKQLSNKQVKRAV